MSTGRISAAAQGGPEVKGRNMVNDKDSGLTRNGGMRTLQARLEEPGHVHPAWAAFMRFCNELRHGEIEQLKIQDGLPLLAEVTKKKVKFT